MTNKHTPGPWEVDASQKSDEHPDYYYINAVGNDNYISLVPGGTRFSISGHIGIENATLIAAAPALLKALQQADEAGLFDMQTSTDRLINHQFRKACRAAIRLATEVTPS